MNEHTFDEILKLPVDEAIEQCRKLAQSSDPFERWYGYKGIGQLKDAASIGLLVAALDRPTVDLGGTDEVLAATSAIGRLGFQALDSYLRPSYLQMKRSQQFRIGLLEAFGETRDGGAVSLIETCLNVDSARAVWLAGTLALAKIGSASLPVLSTLFRETSDVEHRILIADALRKIGSPESQQTLAENLSKLQEGDRKVIEEFFSGVR